MDFTSPSKGKMSFEEMFRDIILYIDENPEEIYKLIVGSDSQAYAHEGIVFVVAVVVHRVGKGGRYYYYKQQKKQMASIRQRLLFETSLSLEVAGLLTDTLLSNGYSDFNIEVHLDAGDKGETKNMIKELTGMVMGSGYDARIKPDSYCATKVADKYTK